MRLKNLQHEDFCRSYALVPNGVRAAHQAGYARSSARFQASRLLRRPDINARIAEVRAETARRNCLDADALFGKLEAVYDMCVCYGRFGPAIRAVEAQARLAGFLTVKGARAEIARTREIAAKSKREMLSNVVIDGPRTLATVTSADAANRVTGRVGVRVHETDVARVLGAT